MKRGFGLSLTVFLLCVFFVFNFDIFSGLFMRAVAKDYKVSGQIVFNQNNDFEYRASIFEAGKGYVIVDPLAIEFVSESGEAIWKKDLASQNVVSDVSKSRIAVSEKKSGNLYLLNLNGDIVAKHNGLGSVDRVKIFDSDHIGVLRTDNTLLLLDGKLENIASTTLPSGTIIDFGIDVSKEDIVAVLLDLDEEPFDTKLVFATFNGSIDRGSSLSEDIAYDLQLEGNRVWVVADSIITQYDFDSTVLSKTPIENTLLKFVYHEVEKALYVLTVKEEAVLSEDSSMYEVFKIDESGEMVSVFQPPISDVKGMLNFGERLLFYSDHQVVIVSTNGNVIETYDSENSIVNVHVLKTGGFALEYENYLDIYFSR